MPAFASFRSGWAALTSYQRLVLGVAFLGWVFDIMDTALFNFAKGPMLSEMLGGDPAYKLHGPPVEGHIQTVFHLGWSIGGLGFGFLADRWGRKRTLIATVGMYCAFTGLTALCRTPDQVAWARFLTGLGIGGEWAAGAALVAETVPNAFRSSAAGILQSAAAFGPILAATVNLGLSHYSWRWLFVVGVLPAALCLVVRQRVEEPDTTRRASKPAGPFSDLFAIARWRRNLIVAAVLGVVGIAGANNLAFWMPNLVKQVSAGLTMPEIQARTSYVTFAMHGGTLVGVFLFPAMCERFGRKIAFANFLICSPIALFAALYGGATYEKLICVLPIASLLAIGMTAGFALYFPELFPPHIRGAGLGLSYNTARIATAPMPIVLGGLVVAHGASTALLMSATIYVVGLAILPLAPETRGLALPTDVTTGAPARSPTV